MDTIEWLTLGLMLLTGLYALITHRILKANEAAVGAMREQIDAANRPFVLISISLRTGTNLIYLSIRNVGRSGADHLRLCLDKDFYQLGVKREEKNLAKLTAFAQEIACLPPDAELLFLLGTGPSIFAPEADPNVSPTVFTVSASYQGGGRSYKEQTTIDLRPFIWSDIPHDPIAEELQKVRKSIDALKNSLDKALRAG